MFSTAGHDLHISYWRTVCGWLPGSIGLFLLERKMLFGQLGGDCSHAYSAMTLRKCTVDDFDFFRIDNQFAVGARLISVEFSLATLDLPDGKCLRRQALMDLFLFICYALLKNESYKKIRGSEPFTDKAKDRENFAFFVIFKYKKLTNPIWNSSTYRGVFYKKDILRRSGGPSGKEAALPFQLLM